MLLDATEKLINGGVILDGIVTASGPQRFTFDDWDFRFNQVAMQLFQDCQKNSFCSTNLFGSQNITTVLHNIFDKLFNKGSCKIVTHLGITAAQLRSVMASLLMSKDAREYIPALLFRLNRCDDDMDFGSLMFFFNQYERNQTISSQPSCTPLFSPLLQHHIVVNEFWEPTTTSYLEQQFNSTFVAMGIFVHEEDIVATWKQNNLLYERDEFFDKTFNTDVASVLILNGNYDPQTPFQFAKATFDLINAPFKYLVELPWAPHYTVMNTPTNGTTLECAMDIMLNFISNPLQQPSLTCTNNLYAINFLGCPIGNKKAFGVSDIWNGIFYPEEGEQRVNLFLFIGVETATLITAVSCIFVAVYWVIETKIAAMKQNRNWNTVYGNIATDDVQN